jgi:hypothetical protein
LRRARSPGITCNLLEPYDASSLALRLDRSAARIRLTVFVSEVMDVTTAETPREDKHDAYLYD